MSAALRFEDHLGPIVPATAPNPDNSTSPPAHGHEHTAALRDLVEQMRRCVVTATTTPDVASKVDLWESYRTARAEALGILASTSGPSTTGTSTTPRLRSV
jgi:hypothetical protein